MYIGSCDVFKMGNMSDGICSMKNNTLYQMDFESNNGDVTSGNGSSSATLYTNVMVNLLFRIWLGMCLYKNKFFYFHQCFKLSGT